MSVSSTAAAAANSSAWSLSLQRFGGVDPATLLRAHVQHHNARRWDFRAKNNSKEDYYQGWERLAYWKEGAQRQPPAARRRLVEENDKEEDLKNIHRATAAVATSMPLSNCHTVLYTAQIAIGTPQQHFTVVLETGSTDLWVPSSMCDDTCYDGWRQYNATASTTYQLLFPDSEADNLYVSGLAGEDFLEGELTQDVVYLTDELSIPQQGFAQITSTASKSDECPGWDGKLGLGPTKEGLDLEDGLTEEYPTVRSNLEHLLRYPVFSLYLDDEDDYPPEDEEPNDDGVDDDTIPSSGVIPTHASSEIVFGGIKSQHYTGCLNWHNVLGYKMKSGETEHLFWNFKLDAVKVTDDDHTALPFSESAIIISDARLSLAHTLAVSKYALLNNMECLSFQEAVDEEYVETVDCSDTDRLDLAFTDCDSDILSLEFVVDGVTYTVGKESLLRPTDAATLGDAIVNGRDNLCLLTVLPLPDVPGWLLGEGFLRLYYAVFDFGKYRIGLAPRAKNNPKVCPEDEYLDVSHQPDDASPGDDNGSATTTYPPATSPLTTSPVAAPNDDGSSPSDAISQTIAPASTSAETTSPMSSPTDTEDDSSDSSDDQTAAPAADPRPPAPQMPPFQPTPSVDTPSIPKYSPPSNTKDSYSSGNNSDDDSSGASYAIPLAIAGVLGVVGVVFWRRRRKRYERAAYFDDMAYRMGDMELREIY